MEDTTAWNVKHLCTAPPHIIEFSIPYAPQCDVLGLIDPQRYGVGLGKDPLYRICSAMKIHVATCKYNLVIPWLRILASCKHVLDTY
jgi:hypothetical protein